MNGWRALAACCLLLAGRAVSAAQPPAPSSCLSCHGNPDVFDQDSRTRVVEAFASDVHGAAGLSCQDCHGGNPDPALADDMDRAMASDDPQHPYRGVPERAAIPAFCGRCHSDPAYMRRFNPELRVDQEREYGSSHHGQGLARGDLGVATCADCHGAHGILAADDPRSPVYPRQVAETCRKCHGDAKHMAGRSTADGRPLPIDQYERWRRSVHAQALLDKEDLSAPTCNDCHGNHGAAPPGVASIAFVCGRCHAREAELFRQGPKHAAFEAHNELLADAGPESCAACHSAPEPQAALTGVRAFSECITCHGNHGVVRPTIAMLSPLPATPCAFCHESTDAKAAPPVEPAGVREHYLATRDALLASATTGKVAEGERFDWLIDRALALPAHTLPPLAEGGAPRLRPEFERLFAKFRIGKTTYTFRDPQTGAEVRAPIVRCSDCHAEPAVAASDPVGATTSAGMLAGMRELIGTTARAERLLLAARRGGVETRRAAAGIDQAVDHQIALEVLVHGFAAGPQSGFAAKQAEGVTAARGALAAGREALAELGYRRRGLVVALAITVVFLVALWLKIRTIGSR
jgi:hypothetical protein